MTKSVMQPSSRNPLSELGATAAEYALLITLIAGVIVGVAIALGTAVVALYDVPFPG